MLDSEKFYPLAIYFKLLLPLRMITRLEYQILSTENFSATSILRHRDVDRPRFEVIIQMVCMLSSQALKNSMTWKFVVHIFCCYYELTR